MALILNNAKASEINIEPIIYSSFTTLNNLTVGDYYVVRCQSGRTFTDAIVKKQSIENPGNSCIIILEATSTSIGVSNEGLDGITGFHIYGDIDTITFA